MTGTAASTSPDTTLRRRTWASGGSRSRPTDGRRMAWTTKMAPRPQASACQVSSMPLGVAKPSTASATCPAESTSAAAASARPTHARPRSSRAMRAANTAATATPWTSAIVITAHDTAYQASSDVTTSSPTRSASGAVTTTTKVVRSTTSMPAARWPARDRMMTVLPAA